MGRSRIQLHDILLEFTEKIYFQPRDNVTMEYPCIVYKRDRSDTKYANGIPYSVLRRYMITVIDRSPDSDIPNKVAGLPTCRHERFYVANNLNHDVFLLYF